MRIGLCSDLHIDHHPINEEFFDWRGDVLIIAGDLMELGTWRGNRFDQFFSKTKQMAPKVFWLAGNHEYYLGDLYDCDDQFRSAIRDHKHVKYLQRELVSLSDDLDLFAGTMWTDLSNPVYAYNAERGLNDYRAITAGDRKLRATDTTAEFHRFVESVKSLGRPTLVATHHSPSLMSIPDRFRGSPLNPGFCSDLSGTILDNPNIIGWFHGHTHDKFDYEIGQCVVGCNPRGYPSERPNHLPPYQPQTFEFVNGSLTAVP